MKKAFSIFIFATLTISFFVLSVSATEEWEHEHTFDLWNITTSPTKHAVGKKTSICSTCGTFEEREISKEIKMVIGQSKFLLNGETKFMHCAPMISNDRTMLPIRYVAESLGSTVLWDTASSVATVKNESTEIKLTIGSEEATVNGKTLILDSPPFIEDDRIYMPVRFVAENLGAAVLWDSATSTVTITDCGHTVSVILDVPFIYQKYDYPNGCESVSTTMVLQDLGIDIDTDTFIDNYLDMGNTPIVGQRGPDPDLVYCGNPRLQTGWGCNSPVIVNALNKFIDSKQFSISHFYGKPLDELCDTYINNNIPVIMWATVNMVNSKSSGYYRYWTTADGKQISYNAALHCLVLIGYDEENYYFNDPLKMNKNGIKYTAYSKSAVENAYSILNQQSIVITPNKTKMTEQSSVIFYLTYLQCQQSA